MASSPPEMQKAKQILLSERKAIGKVRMKKQLQK